MYENHIYFKTGQPIINQLEQNLACEYKKALGRNTTYFLIEYEEATLCINTSEIKYVKSYKK